MRSVLVLGAQGALGKAVIDAFRHSGQWAVVGVDVSVPSTSQSGKNVEFLTLDSPSLSIRDIQEQVLNFVGPDAKLSAVINVAGGWAGGDAKNEWMSTAAELMIRQSLFSSFAAAHVFAVRGAPGSLLAFTGAAAALQPTPGMLGYGTAKAGVHFLCRSLAADPGSLPKDAKVVTVLPKTLDTPGNRLAMPDADTSSWTPLNEVAMELLKWSNDASSAPASGSLVELSTVAKKTTFAIA